MQMWSQTEGGPSKKGPIRRTNAISYATENEWMDAIKNYAAKELCHTDINIF